MEAITKSLLTLKNPVKWVIPFFAVGAFIDFGLHRYPNAAPWLYVVLLAASVLR